MISYLTWNKHPVFVNYKKGCIQLAAASDKVYQLLAHGWWFSPGTPASSTTKTGHHDIAEILLKVALNTKKKSKSKYIHPEWGGGGFTGQFIVILVVLRVSEWYNGLMPSEQLPQATLYIMPFMVRTCYI